MKKSLQYRIINGIYVVSPLSPSEEVEIFKDSSCFKPMIKRLLDECNRTCITDEKLTIDKIVHLKRKYEAEAELYYPFLRAFYEPFKQLVKCKHYLTYYSTILYLLGSTRSNKYLDINLALSKDIVSITERLGIRLKQQGRYFTALCPLHNEKTPSFTVYQDTNSFYCFGCGIGGNVIELVKRVNGFDFYQSLSYLINYG